MNHENRVNRLIRRIGALEERRRNDSTALGAQLLLMARTIRSDLTSCGCPADRISGCESILLQVEDCFGLLDWFGVEYCDVDPYTIELSRREEEAEASDPRQGGCEPAAV